MRVGILANHPSDRRESMHRFARLLHEGLEARGIESVLLRPQPAIGLFRCVSPQWRNRIEKLGFEWRLRRTRAGEFDLLHVTDQGNAIYAQHVRGCGPTVVTCHDLSALEPGGPPAAGMGGYFQRRLSGRIVRGLRTASIVVCDSAFTQGVLQRIVGIDRGKSDVIHLAPQRVYRRLDRAECEKLIPDRRVFETPFLLHVGANYQRKNRAVLIQALALLPNEPKFQIVLAGDPPSREIMDAASLLGCCDRIITVAHPSDETLDALYSTAFAKLFPSFYEGFGWPVLEAQSCGCPVICSDATCLPEIGGDGALYHRPDDAAELARHVVSLFDPAFRRALIQRGQTNAARFSTDKMMPEYLSVYGKLHALASSTRRGAHAAV